MGEGAAVREAASSFLVFGMIRNESEDEKGKKMNAKFEELQVYLDKWMACNTALSLFGWDAETLAPPQSVERTAKVTGILANETYQAIVNPKVEQLLADLKQANDLDEVQRAIVAQLGEQYEKYAAIPPKENQAFEELTSKATHAWARAKEKNDFSAFCPYLEEIISYQKRFADYRRKPGQKRYDVLLGDYEKGFSMEDMDAFFAKMKQAIVPLVKKVQEKNANVDKTYNSLHYDVDKQRAFCDWLTEYIGFEPERGVRGEGEHPCTISLHRDDVRITNHYYENNLESAILSGIHETGHAIYEMGMDEKWTQTPLADGASCGMHESQSRFYENIIGRNQAFWKPVYPKLQATFPTQLGGVTLEQFMAGLNLAEPSLIRTESDELTYCLHIMVRYEAEKKIFEEDYPAADLPNLWNDLYEEYLGVRPQNDAEGILQDVHWAGGAFGYFPSYAVGNAFSAQIYHTMCQEMDMDGILERGELSRIKEWLRVHVHQYAMSKTAREIMRETTGEEFNPDYYIAYLQEKYQ